MISGSIPDEAKRRSTTRPSARSPGGMRRTVASLPTASCSTDETADQRPLDPVGRQLGLDPPQGGFEGVHENRFTGSTGRPSQSPNSAPGRCRSQVVRRFWISVSSAFGNSRRRFWRIISTPASKRARAVRRRSAAAVGSSTARFYRLLEGAVTDCRGKGVIEPKRAQLNARRAFRSFREQEIAPRQTFPFRGRTFSKAGRAFTLGGERLPKEGQRLPAGGECLPSHGELSPAGGECLPPGGERSPSRWRRAPQ